MESPQSCTKPSILRPAAQCMNDPKNYHVWEWVSKEGHKLLLTAVCDQVTSRRDYKAWHYSGVSVGPSPLPLSMANAGNTCWQGGPVIRSYVDYNGAIWAGQPSNVWPCTPGTSHSQSQSPTVHRRSLKSHLDNVSQIMSCQWWKLSPLGSGEVSR